MDRPYRQLKEYSTQYGYAEETIYPMNIKRSFSNINSVAFRRANGEQGSTLVVVLVMLVTMVAIAAGALKVTQLNVSSSGSHKKAKQAFYTSEVGLDVGVNEIITSFENLTV